MINLSTTMGQNTKLVGCVGDVRNERDRRDRRAMNLYDEPWQETSWTLRYKDDPFFNL